MLGVILQGCREFLQAVVVDQDQAVLVRHRSEGAPLVGVRGDQARQASIQEPFACADDKTDSCSANARARKYGAAM